MATEIKAEYIGDEQVRLTHGPTGAVIVTDLPPDNGGKGRMFSPTDLFASSLASCVLTIMAKVAARENIPFEGSSIDIVKEMTEAPRRVARFAARVKLPAGLAAPQREKLLACVKACPVHRSLHPDIKVEFSEL
ncbi:MAG TPA: OsmC family protein [Elusimicrobiales bacterium]|nr:OsmC family protein [Elusimicrobiales bacterium]